jgi:cytochrome P450
MGELISDVVVTPEWYGQHFDHLDPEFGRQFHATLEQMRQGCPVAHSDRHGGFWILTRYEDVLAVLQDWRTFSNADRVAIPAPPFPPLPLNEMDPPIHGVFKRLVNRYLTPAMVAPYERPTRQLVTSLIDEFIETGSCEFMEAFAEQFPRLSFFELVFHAPPDDIAQLNHLTRIVTGPSETPGIEEAYGALVEWINSFVEQRLAAPGRGDIVDAIATADIAGRPITRQEIIGLILLLMFGGFETTSSALGQTMIHFAHHPAIPEQLRSQPRLIPGAVEEFLRIDAPVACMARTVTRDTLVGGQQLRKGDKVLFHLGSANRDSDQFASPATFDANRRVNRHLAFGAGPHRCVGSNIARLNLRVAIGELTARLDDIRLQDGAEPIEYRSAFNRSPVAVPITFTPGRRMVTQS